MKNLLAVLAIALTVPTTSTAAPPARQIDVPSSTADSPLILGAPPRSATKDPEAFGAMARYLSSILQREVVFEPASVYTNYQSNVQSGRYDFVVDGAHLTGWRIKNRKYDALVKVSGEMRFVVIVPTESKITRLSGLRGRIVCTMNPPHLGFLVLQSLFTPAQQPGIRPSNALADVYKGVSEKKCAAGIVRDVMVKKLDPSGKKMRVVHEHEPIPNETLSAGQRVTPSEKTKIVDAFLTITLDKTLAPYQAAYMEGGRFERATNADYLRFVKLLEGQVGF
jgi:ABC-type phosphate/phosphonate transport system substrate-binding protein